MLMKTWQVRAESMNVLKTVPDGKTGKKLKVVSALAGEEGARRALVKQEFQQFWDRATSLASAVKQHDTKLFATLGEFASTLAIVEILDEETWSILSLCVSPDAREHLSIVEAEIATLDELRELCASAGATLRMRPSVEASLAGSCRELGLSATQQGEGEHEWLCAD